MVYVIHDEENNLEGFSDVSPKNHQRYFQIGVSDAVVLAGRSRTGVDRPHLIEYNLNHQAIGLRRSMQVGNGRFVKVALGLINLIARATIDLQEAQKDAEILQIARGLEKEGKIEEAMDLEEPVFLKYGNY